MKLTHPAWVSGSESTWFVGPPFFDFQSPQQLVKLPHVSMAWIFPGILSGSINPLTLGDFLKWKIPKMDGF